MPDIETSVNTSEVAEQAENTTTTQQQDNTTTTEQTVPSTESVNEEVTTSQQKETKPVQTPEENAKFAQLRRDYEAKTQTARQQARDEFIASQGYTWNGKPITTEAEYNQALQEKKYQDAGIDPNLINEAVNNNPILKQAQDIIQKQKRDEEINAQVQELFKEYPEAKEQEIPQSVFLEAVNGVPLVYAYAKYANGLYKAKIAEFQKGVKTSESNAKNAQSSTGSTTGNGSNTNNFITKETFEANKKNQDWLDKNYDLLTQSMNKW